MSSLYPKDMPRSGYQTERQVIVTMKGKGKPPKPKAWSHDDELQAHKGKMISILRDNTSMVPYLLIDSDRFTLKVQIDGTVYVINKSAIVAYSLIAE